MLTTKNKQTNNLPQMKGDLGYGLGFFCGCLVGAAGTYLAFTPEGKLLKQKIIKEYLANQQSLTLELLHSENHPKSYSKSITSIKTLIMKVRQKIDFLINEKPNANDTLKIKKNPSKHYFKKK